MSDGLGSFAMLPRVRAWRSTNGEELILESRAPLAQHKRRKDSSVLSPLRTSQLLVINVTIVTSGNTYREKNVFFYFEYFTF